MLAGLRAYPSDQVRAFFVLAEHPGVLRQLADEPQLFEYPEGVKGVISAEVAAAIRELRTMPGIVMVAAAYPAELEAVRNVYLDAPEGVQQRLQQLRENYKRLAVAAAAAWQRRVADDPVSLGQYRELLTRFCEEQRQVNPGFPCVQVTKREYYYACVPDEAILQYAREKCRASPLHRLLEKWWAYYAPGQIDAGAQGTGWLSGGRPTVPAPPQAAGGAEVVAALPAEQRASMWQADGGADSDAIGLIPVIIQPLADQPAEARREYAVAEHARLWSFQPRLDMLANPPEDDGAGGDVEAVPPEGPGEQEPVAEVVGPWREMTEVGVRARRDQDQRSGWRTYRSCYDRSGYYYGSVQLHYGGYGGCWDYSWLGWPYTRSDLQKLRTLYEITPGGWRSDVGGLGYGYGRRTYVESDGVSVRVGPTTYYYHWPTASRTRGTTTGVGVRRHYRSATEQVGRGLRPYPTYGGRISGAQRRSANQPARGIRRVPQRFGARGTTIGNRRPTTIGNRTGTTIGARGPTVIRQRQPRAGSSRSSLDRYQRTGQTRPRAGIQRSDELRRSQHGVRSSSPRGQRSSRSGLSRGTSRTSGRNDLRRSNNRSR
ncbi:MAG TPA: hypothetical protein VM487_15495 [Phycisphaerae bacterium]|nr:hypothetical protein [Phycisphaerae bacterium]